MDWVDRCDIASHTGLPKPEFKTTDGEGIFPNNDDDPWWLTDISKRILHGDDKNDKELEGDEDGPDTGNEEEPEQREVSDDDPLSEPEPSDLAPCGSASASSTLEFEYLNAWKKP